MKTQGFERALGRTAYDDSGDKVGSVANLYTSDSTGEPEWVTVHTGLFGTKESFVPLAGARIDNNDLYLAPSKAQIKDAPRIDAEGHLSESEAADLYRHYNLGLPQQQAAGERTNRPADQPGSVQRSADDKDAMVRSEERLRAGTETVETGRVRLRKFVVTEEQQVSVPVSHEEVRVVREPVEDGRARAGELSDHDEEEREVVLHEERPVVAKETVAVERVGLNTETVRGEEKISDTVRKEQIEVDGADDTSAGGRER